MSVMAQLYTSVSQRRYLSGFSNCAKVLLTTPKLACIISAHWISGFPTSFQENTQIERRIMTYFTHLKLFFFTNSSIPEVLVASDKEENTTQAATSDSNPLHCLGQKLVKIATFLFFLIIILLYIFYFNFINIYYTYIYPKNVQKKYYIYLSMLFGSSENHEMSCDSQNGEHILMLNRCVLCFLCLQIPYFILQYIHSK